MAGGSPPFSARTCRRAIQLTFSGLFIFRSVCCGNAFHYLHGNLLEMSSDPAVMFLFHHIESTKARAIGVASFPHLLPGECASINGS